MPSIKPGCSYPNLYDDFMTMLDDFSLVQMVTEPTRHENVLDLFLTKRLIRKRDKLFHMQRNSGKNKDRHQFKQVKHFIQTKIRTAYDNYLKDLLGLNVQNADDFIPKKLYSLIKNARQYSQGISTLYDKKESTLVNENKAKTTILNLQFQSVFSQLSVSLAPGSNLH